MFNKAEQDLSLPDRQVRHSLAVRIALVLLAFFSIAWYMLQWTLSTEPRFMVEGITRQFVMLEAAACAGIAAIALVFMVANGLGWLATVIRIHREQSGKLDVKHTARRIGAYV